MWSTKFRSGSAEPGGWSDEIDLRLKWVSCVDREVHEVRALEHRLRAEPGDAGRASR